MKIEPDVVQGWVVFDVKGRSTLVLEKTKADQYAVERRGVTYPVVIPRWAFQPPLASAPYNDE
jgi:hypothetical protein